MLMGLRVNSKVVAGPTEIGIDVWANFLEREPSEDQIEGRRVNISRLKKLLKENKISENSSEEEIIIYARMYNILCVSLSLMPDKSNKIVQSMWIQFLHDLHKCGEHS